MRNTVDSSTATATTSAEAEAATTTRTSNKSLATSTSATSAFLPIILKVSFVGKFTISYCSCLTFSCYLSFDFTRLLVWPTLFVRPAREHSFYFSAHHFIRSSSLSSRSVDSTRQAFWLLDLSSSRTEERQDTFKSTSCPAYHLVSLLGEKLGILCGLSVK